ncbi:MULTISPECIES: DUF4249 family protein [unclassified Lentimicrobium]|uniref:DUF4249 family protein n=1 Tax=unclassified Lentimicrobium TaxID=2677434 RepID=UPI001554EF52|nr:MULTISPECIES: DUF4249 family protein [unclassified Lentimicrobium]NPD48054.1 DUF4249 family protein [Lentimicrobium sp. S6]NPD86536.1 DUF4249 family protein [Lentimicrobium sp. L6]
MKSVNFRYIALFSLLIFLYSCEKVNLQTADPNVAVVESYINPGNEIQVKIKKQIVFDGDDAGGGFIENLEVKIQHEGSWENLVYKYDSIYVLESIVVGAGNVYEIEFEYNEKVITSETIIPNRPENFQTSSSTIYITQMGPGSEPSEPEELTWTNPDLDYHMVVVESIDEDAELIFDSDDDHPPRSFRNAPVQGDEQELSPRSFTYYGRHRVILYRLNPEYAALYEDLGSSSLDLVAPPSNIENGLGIFTGINADTLYVNVIAASK